MAKKRSSKKIAAAVSRSRASNRVRSMLTALGKQTYRRYPGADQAHLRMAYRKFYAPGAVRKVRRRVRKFALFSRARKSRSMYNLAAAVARRRVQGRPLMSRSMPPNAYRAIASYL